MRRIALLLPLLLVACGGSPEPVPASSPAPATSATAAVVATPSFPGRTLGFLLTELESSLAWTPPAEWKARRVAWSQAVVAAGDDVRALAALLRELEQQLAGGAVQDRWKERRADWATELSLARNRWELAGCLAELEANVAWGSATASWKQQRARWIDDLRRASGLAIDDPSAAVKRKRTSLRGALWIIRNQTRRPIRVRWSGPHEGEKIILAADEAKVALAPGHYVVRCTSAGTAEKIAVHHFEAGYKYSETFSAP